MDRGEPLLDALLKNLRRMKTYGPLTGDEIMPIFAPDGSKTLGKITTNMILTGGGPAGVTTTVTVVADQTHTLAPEDHNVILDCIHPSGCIVTVPAGLKSGADAVPFTCGISKGPGGGDVRVVGDSVAINSAGNLFTMPVTYGMMTLTEWPGDTFRLYGAVA